MTDQGQIGVILKPERYAELLSTEKKCLELQSGEQKEQKPSPQLGDKALKALDDKEKGSGKPKFEYDGRPYEGVYQSQIKVGGIIDKFMANPTIAKAFESIPKETLDAIREKWLPVVVYEAMYENVDGQIWVRMKEDFDSKFKRVS